MLLSRVLVIGNIFLDVHGRERSRAEVGAGVWVCVFWSCVSSGTSVCVRVRVRVRGSLVMSAVCHERVEAAV